MGSLARRGADQVSPAGAREGIKRPHPPDGGDALLDTPAPIVVETKLHPPPVPANVAARRRLARRLAESHTSLVVVSAPAGYGKSTLLAQHAAESEAAGRPLAWLSLDSADNDPVVLLSGLATALARITPVEPQVFRGLTGARKSIDRVVLPGLVNALGGQLGLTLALDDLHRLDEPASLSIVAFLAEHVPSSARVVVATRDASALPLGRIRVGGGLLELDAQDLALGRGEVEGLLRAAAVPVHEEQLDAIVLRTEGWPLAVFLTVHALAASTDRAVGIADLIAGDDRDIVDYFSSELLSRQSPESLAFLLRTSILERLSAPLCDAVLDRGDSASLLAALEDENLFLVPLDRAREWYRYHPLFRDVLRTELNRHDPGAAATLHRRAAEWHDRHGTAEEAVAHALAAPDMARAAELVVANARTLQNSGRNATIRRWIDAFTDEDVARSAPLAMTCAYLMFLLGQRDRARRYVALAQSGNWSGVGALGESSLESAVALANAVFGCDGVSSMHAHAVTAYRLEPVGRPAHEPAAHALGMSLLLLGRTDEAVPLLEEAAALGPARAVVTLMSLGQLAQIALEERRDEEAEALATRGLALAHRLGLEERIASASLHVALACLGVNRGDRRAREHLDHGVSLVAGLSAMPLLEIQTRALLGRVALALGEPELAASLLEQARRGLARFPDAGVLSRLLAREEHQLEAVRGGGGVLPDHLTNAERRVLDLLPTHLSVSAIAEVLHISTNTVKSHQRAIYRKLGVARRADAVSAARRLGILDAKA